jgi:uncharacterized protein involved in exopolysaccharide biosynthesis
MTPDNPSPTVPDDTAPAVAASAVSFFLRNRRVFVIAFLAVAAAVVFLGYPSTSYTSVLSFVTEAQRGGAVGSLAAQLGIMAPSGQNSFTTPLFYPELLKSQQFLGDVAEAKVPGADGRDSVSLIDVFGLRSADPRLSRELASRILNEAMYVSPAPQTGIVKVSVTTGDPRLSQAIAQIVLDKIHEYNIRARQGRAAAERQFVERRLAEVKSDLRAVEDRLQAFLQQNRDFSKSPTLQFQRDRLEQEVMLQRQIALAMTQSYEQAKIDEVRDTPVVTVLSQPELPVLPDPRGRIRLLLIAVFAGIGAGAAVLYAYSQFVHHPSAEAPRDELRRLATELSDDIRRGRLVHAMFGRSNGEKSQKFVSTRH